MEPLRNSPILKPLAACLLTVAVATFSAAASAAAQLDAASATRLQIRAGLGPDPALAATWRGRGRDAAVDAMVDAAAARRTAAVAPPDWVGDALPEPRRGQDRTPEERRM